MTSAARPAPFQSSGDVHSSGGVVLKRTGDSWFVALVRRHDGGWVLPKGHMNPGESVETAAMREICEETGLHPSELEIMGYLGEYAYREYEPDPRPKKNHFLLFLYAKDDLPSLNADVDHAAADWQPLPPPVDMKYEYQREILKQVAHNLSKNTYKTK